MSMVQNDDDDEDMLPDPPTESRGAPDGCGLDPASSETMTKKGWLMKQGLTKEWHKYWFVLQDVALLYYRDPKAESKGFLDGIIDLSLVQRIDKQDLPRHFGFYIRTFEGKTFVFSAITDGIRKNWIASLQKAANVSPSSNRCDSNSGSFNDSNNDKQPSKSYSNNMDVITTNRIVRTSTTTSTYQPPTVTKVEKLPPPTLTLQTTTSTMSFSNTDPYGDDGDETTDEKGSDEDDYTDDTDDDEPPEIIEKRPPEIETKLNDDKDLAMASSTIAKQNSEIQSLKKEISLNQMQIQQNLEALQGEKDRNAELQKKIEELNVKLEALGDKLRIAEDAAAKEVEKANELRHDFECNLGKLETEVDKWKLLHESLYLQYNRELRSWKDKISRLEKACEATESSQADEMRAKTRIIHDLSEQLKESDDRIQELSMELDAMKEKNAVDFAVNNQESIGKFILSMEEKFAATLKTEKEQLEQAFQEKLKEHEMYEQQQRLVTAGVNATASSFGNWTSVLQRQQEEEEKERKNSNSGEKKPEPSGEVKQPPKKFRRPSLVKINSMTDLLSLRVPSVEAIETMAREDMTEKFLILLDHFYASVDEIRKLRVKLRESQDYADALEIDKARFEETFKRTIVMQEQQETLMSKRLQDLANKLQVSEKTVRQLKEGRKHSKRKDSNLGLGSGGVSASGTPVSSSH